MIFHNGFGIVCVFSRLNLFSYMSADFIIEKLGRVCKPLRRFILSSQSYWKYRYQQRVRASYRSVPSTHDSWLNVCYQLERVKREWKKCAEERLNILSISGAHIGPITDTILLEVYLKFSVCFVYEL